MKVEFLKKRFYQGKTYNVGTVIDMPESDAKIYRNYKAVKIYIKKPKPRRLEEYNYKDLQQLCKNNNLPAAGSKDKLIETLKEHQENLKNSEV